MPTLTKGEFKFDLPEVLFKDFNAAVHHIHTYFSDHTEIQRLTPDIERSVVDRSSIIATFDFESVNTHPTFMRDRMIERWNTIQRRDPKIAVATETITQMGAFYLIEWHRAAFLHSTFRLRLIRACINFTHLDDGRLAQTVKLKNPEMANMVFEFCNKEDPALENHFV